MSSYTEEDILEAFRTKLSTVGKLDWELLIRQFLFTTKWHLAGKISDYQMPNDQKSLNDQKMYAKQFGELFFQKYHTILQ